MLGFFTRLLDSSGFVPRRFCGEWTTGLILLHNVSDLLIWLAYLAIPLVLLVFARRRNELVFRRVFFLFLVFIVSCGFTHALDVVMFYKPLYHLAGLAKAVTAVASWVTVVALVPIVPKVLAMRSPEVLEQEIVERRRVEGELRALQAHLEERVAQRTAELEDALAALRLENDQHDLVQGQLRASREQLRIVTDNAPVRLLHCDTEQRCKFVNRPYADSVGLTPQQMVGQRLRDVLGGGSYERIRVHVEQALTGTRVDRDVEEPTGGPATRWMHLTCLPSYSDAGAVTGAIAVLLDVTERWTAETSLLELNTTLERQVAERTQAAESQRRWLDAVLEALPVAVTIGEPDGRLARMNRAGEQVWGAAPLSRDIDAYDEWVGYWPATGERIRPEDWAMSRALLKGETCSGELIEFVRFGDGSRRMIMNSAAPVWGPDGKLLGAVVAAMDVTARLDDQAALRESEERFRGAFDFAPIGMALVAPDGRWLQVNRSLCELIGYTEQEFQATDFQTLTHSDDLASHMADAGSVLTGTKPHYQLEKRYVHKRGHVVYTLSTGSLIRDRQGHPLYFIVQIKDITQRKRDQQALAAHDALLRQFIKYSPAAIAMFDADMRYLQMSDRWLIDYQLSGRDLTGLSHYEVFPEISEEWKAVHRRVLAGAVEKCDEDAFPRADGSIGWMQWECRPWRDGSGAIGGLAMFTQVVTGRRLIEEKVKASLQEKELLLKEIHHRVKNNLQIVSTLLDLQSGYTTDPATVAMFQESRGRVKSMALIHERLYRSGDLARVDFAGYTRQLVADLYRAYKVSDEDIRLELDIDIPVLGIDVAIPCGLLLNELITNCLKHAFAGAVSGSLRVALHRTDGINVLTVADDGPGLPVAIDFRTTTSFGLQLVNTLVDQLDGEIALVSGPGTTFTIRFPGPTHQPDERLS